jgi:hypothetical protein
MSGRTLRLPMLDRARRRATVWRDSALTFLFMVEWVWKRVTAQIQWVPGMAILSDVQSVKLRQDLTHCPVALNVRAANAPRRNDDLRSGCERYQGGIVVHADRFGSAFHVSGIGGAKRKEIGHAKCRVSPPFRVAHALADRWVVVAFVGGRGIQPYKHAVAAVSPTSPELIAVRAAS